MGCRVSPIEKPRLGNGRVYFNVEFLQVVRGTRGRTSMLTRTNVRYMQNGGSGAPQVEAPSITRPSDNQSKQKRQYWSNVRDRVVGPPGKKLARSQSNCSNEDEVKTPHNRVRDAQIRVQGDQDAKNQGSA